MSLTLDFNRASNLDPRERGMNFGVEYIEAEVVDEAEVDAQLGVSKIALERIAGLPVALVNAYVDAAMRHAYASNLGEDGWFVEVKGFEGVYGDGESLDDAVRELRAALPIWLEMKLAAGGDIPDIDGFTLPQVHMP